jgi:hypothetical protein
LGDLSLLDLHPEAGWAANTDWNIPSDPAHPGSNLRPHYPREATINDISDNALRADPFCRAFNDSNLTGSQGSSEATNTQVRAEVLGVGLPALSHETGANSVSVFIDGSGDRNIPLMSLKAGWPSERIADQFGTRWLHSDLKDVAYPFNHKLHDTLVELGGLNY